MRRELNSGDIFTEFVTALYLPQVKVLVSRLLLIVSMFT